ncbi:MAG: 4Fe-4S binding protein [Opitutae bacterium]|nr:4Fe-4S binding protein [Opitutae bacterium]
MSRSQRLGWRLLLLCAALLALPACAGVLTQDDLARHFHDAIRIGPKDAKVPVWPIVKLDGPTETVVAYAFESMDLAPIPGFAGLPFNLLVALDRRGEFLEVRVLSQHEPVFLDGLGPEPLFRFVEQYRGKNLQQNIRVGARSTGADAHLDGVTKATASVRIVNETVLAAALQVARAKLGYAQGRSAAEAARVRDEVFERLTWPQLLDQGYVGHRVLTNGEVETAFRGTVGEGQDNIAREQPGAPFTELWYAYLNVPTVGRSLLGDAGHARLMARVEPGQHVLWVASRGRYGFVGEDYVRGAVPERLGLRQNGLPIELRDREYDVAITAPGLPPEASARTFAVYAQAGFDPAQPWTLALRATRQKGMIFPETVTQDFGFDYALPARFFVVPESEATRAWKAVWAARAADLTILAAALLGLTFALVGLNRLAARPRWLARFRWGFLAFTLGFVGWYAQGQLSVVNLTGPLQAALRGGDFAFLLYDPVTFVVGAYTLATLFVWGRGSFCGWLCPFGALQEFIGTVAQRLRVPQWKIGAKLDRRLERIKYAVLAAILLAAALAPAWADRLVEVEPFKTAITLGFVRAWPFVLYAVLLLAASAFSYKLYCRYLCPLGAGLALLGRVRLFDWLRRRPECGQPCGLCHHRCRYQAIERDGRIRYAECFQCLECVAIYEDRQRCAPLMLRDKRAKG